jgi:nitrate/TMAO reductase-like tetraheme cytochrome c subunit
MPGSIREWFRMRPLRMLGGFLVFLSLALLAFLVLLDIVAGLSNPYLGIITYMVLPAVLVLGLLLVPIDSWLQRRREARGEAEYPVIDLCNPFQRRIVGFFTVASVVVLIVMTVVTYKAVEFMDTTTFCGKVCHKVMIPEYTAYSRSPHASVACIECHIGSGASWFVRSKLTGLPQVYHVTRGDYDRPLQTPVKALRPSRDTCEHCHWPKAFYGSTLRTIITYKQDEHNTLDMSTQLMHVGSGSVPGSGIHSHMIATINYLPAKADHREIAWVRIKRPDGSIEEFVNPTYSADVGKLRKQFDQREMDCIDCHNRAAHDFVSFETLLDDDLTRRTVDPSIPFIKKQAMAAVGDMESVPTQADQARTVAKINEIRKYYETQMPDIYKTRSRAIAYSVGNVRQAYLDSAFPHMRVGAKTYPNWRTHEGCFRCHGTLVAASPKGRDQMIPAGCNLCHNGEPKPVPPSGEPVLQ